MTRRLDQSEGKNYLKKAEDSMKMASIAIDQGAYDSSIMSSIHSAINALDALSVIVLGKRASGAHTDSLLTLKSIFTPDEYSDLAKQFRSLMSKKNISEYEPVLMSRGEAESCLKWAERIMDRVKRKIDESEQ